MEVIDHRERDGSKFGDGSLEVSLAKVTSSCRLDRYGVKKGTLTT